MQKHEVKFEMNGIEGTALWTAEQLAEVLISPDFHLISVNAPKQYFRRKRKKVSK